MRAAVPTLALDERLEPGGAIDSAPLVQPTILLPMQLEPSQDVRLSGARALMLAVLEEAILCIQTGARSRDWRTIREAQRARRWVERRDRSWLFAFENVCTVLEVDAEAVRTALLGTPARRAGLSTPLARRRVSSDRKRRITAELPRKRIRGR